jgi:D-methionine transport system ATP-binding protein
VISVFTHPQQPITRQFVRQISQYEEAEFNPDLNADLDGTVIKLTLPDITRINRWWVN